MASLGALVVSLGLDAASFTSGLSKAELMSARTAKSIADNLEKGAVATIGALGALATAAGGAFIAIDAIASRIANYQDMADTMGDTAEAVASLQLAADLSGTSMETVVGASVKLTASLAKTNEETKGAGKAIAALGLNLDEFKQLAPAEQMEAVAMALGEFEDGAEKTAVAVALFGKSGAALIPMLKDLQEEGGLTVRVTQAQVEAADEYDKAKKRLGSTLSSYVDFVALTIVPTMTDLANAFITTANEVIGMDEEAGKLAAGKKIQAWADSAIRAFAFVIDSADGVKRVFKGIGETLGAAAAYNVQLFSGNLAGAQAIAVAWGDEMRNLGGAKLAGQALVEVYDKAAAARKGMIGAQAGAFNDRRAAGGGTTVRPKLNFDATTGGGAKKGGAEKDPDAEAKRYLETLQKTQDKLEDLTALETLYSDIKSGRLKVSSDTLRAQLEAAATMVDLSKDEEARIKELAKAEKERAEQKKKLESEVAAAVAEGIGPIERTAAEVARYYELVDLGVMKEEEAAAAAKRKWDAITPVVKEKVEEMSEFTKQAAKNIQDLVGNALGDVLLGKFDGGMKGILSKWTETLAQMAAQAAAAELMTSLLGSGNGTKGSTGGGWLSAIMSAFGGGKAEGGGLLSGTTYLVGERGPEKLTMGSSGHITPNEQLGASGGSSEINVNTTVNVGEGGSRTSRSGDSDATAKALAATVEQLTRAAIQKETLQGGVLWKQRMGYA